MSDLQAKYQKLATEYSKLRAQLPVLKKAVIDEQTKEEELKESIKGKDQRIRKYEQEIDSLSFRNQQLSARVSVLQQELEEEHIKGKTKHKKQNAAQDTQTGIAEYSAHASIIGEELQSKIEENARLHSKVHDVDEAHRRVLLELQDRLSALESDASQHQAVLEATRQNSKGQIDRLQEEKALLEIRLQRQEKDAHRALARATDAEERLVFLQRDLSTQLEKTTSTIRSKLPFNDTELPELNALNVPCHNRKRQLRTKELAGQALGLVRELVQGLSNYYTYSEQRAKAFPVDADLEPLSDINKKYCQYLHENASYLRPVEQSFKAFAEDLKEDSLTTLETASGLQPFSACFKIYVAYANKLLSYQLLSLEEECAVSSCSSTLEAKNMELHTAVRALVAALSKLDTYISIIAAQNVSQASHPQSSHCRLFEQTARAITDFHEVVKDVSKLYNGKVSLEHQLPTTTQKLRVTDECLVSALVSLVTCTSKISAFFAGNLDFFYNTLRTDSAPSTLTTPQCNPEVNLYRQRAADFLSLIAKPNPESVPYATAIQNRKTLYSSTESRDSLSQQVVTLQDKASRLEQDKEHWMLESQLMQMKYEKEKQKVGDIHRKMKLLETKLSGSIEDNLDTADQRPSSVISMTSSLTGGPGGPIANSVINDSILGHVASMGESDGDEREKLIKQHFSNRLSELTCQLQLADSKALHFHAECRALHKRLMLAQKDRDQFRDDLSTANQSVAQLKDELQTTTKSYEGQLSMMSEHLAGMNERLTSQKDEIDVLKYQLNNAKGNKKGKSK